MKVTYLSHSGFLVECKRVDLLFDYIGGALPPASGKPLLVFASHSHEDHFSAKVFDLGREATYIFSSDIETQQADNISFVEPEEMFSPHPGVLVETLSSTDLGVAFLVTVGTETVFHAGDLNWWHWEGEPDPWNPQMAVDFQRYCAPLAGRLIDLAMLPLDPRLGVDGFRGPRHILKEASVERFLPMHQWKNFDFTDQFLAACPEFAHITHKITHKGQVFDF